MERWSRRAGAVASLERKLVSAVGAAVWGFSSMETTRTVVESSMVHLTSPRKTGRNLKIDSAGLNRRESGDTITIQEHRLGRKEQFSDRTHVSFVLLLLKARKCRVIAVGNRRAQTAGAVF